jgi:hypothetical protein
MFNITVEKICQYDGYSWKRFWPKRDTKGKGKGKGPIKLAFGP